jgi:hypothetical protein
MELLVLTVLASRIAGAQMVPGPEARDDRFRTLALVRARAEYDRAAGELARADALKQRQLMAESDFDAARAGYARARVDYLQQAIALLSAQPHIVIVHAVKHRGSDGMPRVRVALANAVPWDGGDAARQLPVELTAELRAGVVRDVFVSVKAEPGASGTTISRPYEQRVARLRGTEPSSVEFALLRDVSEAVIAVTSGDATVERKVLLETDLAGSAFALRAGQASLEAALGAQVSYDLVVERPSAGRATAQLAVRGLSDEVQHEFREAGTQARLNGVHFADGETSKRLQLVLTLPATTVPALAEGSPARFWVLAGDSASLAAAPGGSAFAARSTHDGEWGASIGRVQLQLALRGIPRAEVALLNLFEEIALHDSASLDVAVRNVGSSPLRGARLEADAAPGWRVHFEPGMIPDVPPGGAATMRMLLVPAGDATVGDYEARVHVDGAAAAGQPSEEKVLRVRIVARTPWSLLALGLLLLAGLLAASIAVGRRMLRR